jgi:hypothetical protein
LTTFQLLRYSPPYLSSDGTTALALARLTQRASHALRYERARRRRDDRPRTPRAMKFGSYFEQQMEPEWREWYIRYGEFKILLKQIRALNEELASKNASPDTSPGVHARVSSTPPKDLIKLSFSFMETRPGNSGLKGERPLPSEAAFFEALDEDVKRVGSFVESTLARLKRRVEELEVEINDVARCAPAPEACFRALSANDDACGDTDISSLETFSKPPKRFRVPSDSESRTSNPRVCSFASARASLTLFSTLRPWPLSANRTRTRTRNQRGPGARGVQRLVRERLAELGRLGHDRGCRKGERERRRRRRRGARVRAARRAARRAA